jgi:hypothetical protein
MYSNIAFDIYYARWESLYPGFYSWSKIWNGFQIIMKHQFICREQQFIPDKMRGIYKR